MTVIIAILNFIVIATIAFLIKKKTESIPSSVYWGALTLKLAAGIALGLLYSHYYASGDTFSMFEAAREQAKICRTDPGAYIEFLLKATDTEWKGAARSVFFVKMVSLVSLFTNGNYWITSLWFSFATFLSAIFLVKTIVNHFPGSKIAAALAFLFFPSVVFWSAGLIKESIALAALLVLAAAFINAMKERPIGLANSILIILSLWIAWKLKYYWLSVFLPIACTSIIVRSAAARWQWPNTMKVVLWAGLLVGLGLLASQLHPNFYPSRLLGVVVDNYNAFVAISDPQNVAHFGDQKPTWSSVLQHAPAALITGLFRPFLWEANNSFQVIAAIENLVVFFLVISSLWGIRRFVESPERLIGFSVIAYVIMLCVFLTLSTPNFGSLSRYKIGFLPFLVFLTTYKNIWLQRLLDGNNQLKKP